MDFVIAGLALGSTLAIVGFLMREAGLSRRVSLPWWVSGTGLVLMAAAVVVWCLTVASLVTDQPDSTATTLIASGAVVSLIAGFVLLAKAGASRAPASVPAVANANVRVSVDPVDVIPVAEERPESSNEHLHDEETLEAPISRGRRDWEAIWRETWGSGDLPRTLGPFSTSESEWPLEESDAIRQTWSADAEGGAVSKAQPDRELTGSSVQVDEHSPDEVDKDDARHSPNGEAK